MYISRKLLLLVCCLLLLYTGVMGQASSTNYQLRVGEPVAGGGASTSAGYGIKGSMPLSPRDYSSSTNYQLRAGVISTATAFGAAFSYAGSVEQIVPLTNRVLKIASEIGTSGITATLYYRRGGETSYSNVALSAGSGDTLQYSLNANLLGLRTLEYYFEIESGGQSYFIGSPSAPYRFITSLTNAQGRRPAAMPDASYRIVGLPVEITGVASVEGVFRDDLGAPDITSWRLGRYYATTDTTLEYPADSTVRPGQGYWLIARDGKRYGAAGFSMRPNRSVTTGPLTRDYYEVPVDSGWNQIVNPLPFPVTWAEVLMDNGGVVAARDAAVITDTLYSYNGSNYVNITTLPAWDGVFVLVKQHNVKLLFPYVEAGASAQRPAPEVASSVPQWFVELSLANGSRQDNGNFVGVFADASEGLDNYDLYEPPLPPGGSRMSFRLPDGSSSPHRCDYRPPFEEGAIWEVELSAGTDRVLTVSRTMHLPENMDMWLVLDIGERHRLEEGKTIPLASDVSSAQLIIGNPDFASSHLADGLPTDYAISQNFPNPFNPRTTIRYAVPVSGHVNLVVLNILGQRVTTLVDGFVEAGHHSAVWEGTDESGSSLASGVYFYRVEAGSFRDTKKMMLLK